MDSSNVEEPAMVDAAMLDPTMEDLFGDAADGLNVGMTPAPLPASLILRIAEMQSSGCCAKLAWGNTGSIAHISADGSKVSFYALVRDMKTKLWAISAESKYPIKAPQGRTFVHVQFGALGVDLALVDSAGMVHMRTLAGALGRMVPAERDPTREIQPKNELDTVVGMYWLCLWPNQFTGPYIHPANKVGSRWEAHLQTREQNAIKAHHPAAGRHATLYINRSTELTLLYQNEGQGWQSTSIFLEPISFSDELISHAALGEEGADLLAVTYDNSSRLRLYRVTIEWNAVPHTRGQAQYMLVNPTLGVHRLTASHNARPQHADGAKLTHLRLIPAIPEAAQSQPTLPTVIAVFTQTSFSVDATQPHGSFSIIAHWRVESSMPTLHASFKKLTGRDSNAVHNPITVLRRSPDIMTNKVILSVRSQMFDTIIAFGASDGTVEMRERLTMDLIGPFGDTNTASNLPSSGFDHLAGPHNNHVTMSADGSGVVVVRQDGKVAARPMAFTHGWQVMDDDIGDNDNKPFIEAAAVCVARQYAFLCYNSISNDESLALLPIEATLELRATVVKTIFKMVNKSPDISMHDLNRQQMTVVKEPVVPRVLSVQLALGTDHATGLRNFAAQYAFTVLNLRHISTAVLHTTSVKDINRISTEAIHSLCPLVRWSIDLIIHIAATLLDVKRSLSGEAAQSAKQTFEDLIAKNGSPAIHLLLCSYSRALLRFQVSWIGKFLQVAHQVAPRAHSVAARQDLMAMYEQTAKLPLKLHQVDIMLGEFDAAIRSAYNPASLPADRRSEIEISMICDGVIPSELEPALNALMETMLPKLSETADQSRLYFWNTDHLQLRSSKPQSSGNVRWDVIRKVPLRKGMAVRLCRRCGCEMEDLPHEKARELPLWLMHQQKHCICMNYWILP